MKRLMLAILLAAVLAGCGKNPTSSCDCECERYQGQGYNADRYLECVRECPCR